MRLSADLALIFWWPIHHCIVGQFRICGVTCPCGSTCCKYQRARRSNVSVACRLYRKRDLERNNISAKLGVASEDNTGTYTQLALDFVRHTKECIFLSPTRRSVSNEKSFLLGVVVFRIQIRPNRNQFAFVLLTDRERSPSSSYAFGGNRKLNGSRT